MSTDSNEKKGWKETITTVAAVAAILVAALGYYQFVEWKGKTEKDFEKLQGKMESNFEKRFIGLCSG